MYEYAIAYRVVPPDPRRYFADPPPFVDPIASDLDSKRDLLLTRIHDNRKRQ